MTFKDLQRLVESSQQPTSNPKLDRLMQRLRITREFWIWDQVRHEHTHKTRSGNCCFNHIIGLPQKNGKRKPMFDYEQILYRALMDDSYLNGNPGPASRVRTDEYHHLRNDKGELYSTLAFRQGKDIKHPFKCKHAAVLKSSGLGITELCLRFIAWLCLRNDELQGSSMIIFTGPRLELAVSLITRLKDLFKPHGITFSDKETVCNLNGVRIEAFPSFHCATARGLPNVSLVDEASFIPDGQAGEIVDIMLRYVPKSNPYLIAVSTPNKPGDLMEQIMIEPFETSPFKRLWLDWTYGIDKIYTRQEGEKVKNKVQTQTIL